MINEKKLRKEVHRNILKTLRFTSDENKKINDLLILHNIKFSDYARSKILNLKIKTNIEIDYIYQIKKIGTNINQIAKKINQNNSSEKIELLEKLLDIENQLKKLNDDS